MIDGHLLIEKLLEYAKSGLELSEFDVCYKRNALLYAFRLDAGEAPFVSAEEEYSYSALKEEISAYATENGICTAGSVNDFVSFVFGVLSPSPSTVNKKFRTLREKFGATAACDYYYNVLLNSGMVSMPAKDVTTEIFSENGMPVIAVKNANSAAANCQGAYCDVCVENEGAFNGGNSALRSVILDLGGAKWSMRYVDGADVCYEAVVSLYNHARMKEGESMIDEMLDFVDYVPQFFIAYESNPFDKKQTEHARFIAGKCDFPAFSAKSVYSLSSESCPDVEICVTDWYCNHVRLSSFNRYTLEKLAYEIIKTWVNYSDETISISGWTVDGRTHNYYSVAARFAPDGRYTVDIIFTGEKFERGWNYGCDRTGDFLGRVFGVKELFGRFVFDNGFSAKLDRMSSFIAKKAKFDEKYFAKGGELDGFNKFYADFIGSEGFIKDLPKAETAVKKAVSKYVADALNSTVMFDRDEAGTRGFKRFLANVKVK